LSFSDYIHVFIFFSYEETYISIVTFILFCFMLSVLILIGMLFYNNFLHYFFYAISPYSYRNVNLLTTGAIFNFVKVSTNFYVM
jgi:hypothetical protein